MNIASISTLSTEVLALVYQLLPTHDTLFRLEETMSSLMCYAVSSRKVVCYEFGSDLGCMHCGWLLGYGLHNYYNVIFITVKEILFILWPKSLVLFRQA